MVEAIPSNRLQELVSKMRASFTILGPLVARFGEASVPLPGGCDLGTRAVDFHLKGLQAMGAEVSVVHGQAIAHASKLHGANVLLDCPSVGTTNHLLSVAVLAHGRTVIENAALEPEIIDLARMLSEMGANIKGAGTHRIEIEGVRRLKAVRHTVIPDRIEAATFMIAGAMTRGDIVVRNVVEDHLLPVVLKLRECGVDIQVDGPALYLFPSRRSAPPLTSFRVRMNGRPNGVHVTAMPHPGFPTDAHPVLGALMTLANGTSLITETVYDRRFRYCNELQRMGANITVTGQNAVIEGVDRLTGAQVSAPDLRGGAALVLAGLAAEGETEISDLQFVDRVYEEFVRKLEKMGAKIERYDPSLAVRRPSLCMV